MSKRERKENSTIGERLKEIRKRRGYSQAALGGELGLAQRTISSYETGRCRLSATLLLKITSLLRASTSELLGQKRPNGSAKDRKTWKLVEQIESLLPKDKRAAERFIEALSGNDNGRRMAA